jgi:hypothetical protein
MIVLMKDSFRHEKRYPFYTLALTDQLTDDLSSAQIPIVIRQYAPQDIVVDTFQNMVTAYETFKLFVGEEQPFIPALDRKGA